MQHPYTDFHVVAIAASAGGLAPIREILAPLPVDFSAAVLVIQHTSPGESHLVPILARGTKLPVKQAEDGDRLEPGHIYVAPPDEQMLVGADDIVSLAPSERAEHRGPSANRLFESLAGSVSSRAIAVVLSGMGQDGSAGIRAIKEWNGTVIAQDEVTSQFYSMPRSAIATDLVDFILPVQEIPAKLLAIVESEPAG